MAAARRLARGRAWLAVSGLEAEIGTRFTTDTIMAIQARRPDLACVWVMGADSLAGFHRWRDWRGIAGRVPMLIVSRPGYAMRALTSPAARALAPARRPPSAAASLPGAAPPAWVYLPGISVPVSSTALRAARSHPPS